jgi:osmotically-inducible protein OsmY
MICIKVNELQCWHAAVVLANREMDMRSDSDIRHDIESLLDTSPKIATRDIAVSVRGGVVTLAGFVRGYGERARAEAEAKCVAGVIAIANDIEVRLPLVSKKPDPQIARELAAAIRSDLPTIADHVQVRVTDGRVTLEGEVGWYHQRTRAEELIRTVRGVRTFTNDLVVKYPIQ